MQSLSGAWDSVIGSFHIFHPTEEMEIGGSLKNLGICIVFSGRSTDITHDKVYYRVVKVLSFI
jgi:hypothetical protein